MLLVIPATASGKTDDDLKTHQKQVNIKGGKLEIRNTLKSNIKITLPSSPEVKLAFQNNCGRVER